MAKRNRANITGDKNEFEVGLLLLEHGYAINALTAADTGWDLHCHVTDQLIVDASKAPGTSSWSLSGQTLHVQVKGVTSGDLRVGTVRGWLSGTASGTPTFMFWRQRGKPIFSTPENLAEWFESVPDGTDDGVDRGFSLQGSKRTLLSRHVYDALRFPSIVQLWTRVPYLAMEFPGLTSWMNHEAEAKDPRDEIVAQFANAIWADLGYRSDGSQSDQLSVLEQLYEALQCQDPVQKAEDFLGSGHYLDLAGLHDRFTRSSTLQSVARTINPSRPLESALDALQDLAKWFRVDAASL